MLSKQIYADAPAYCHSFFDLVQESDLLTALQSNKEQTIALLNAVPTNKENFAYADGKWTTKEVFRHIIDCERIYAYRAFRFSRFDATELASFDVSSYITNTHNLTIPLSMVLTEFVNLRNSTINLFETMTDEMLDFKGIANKVSFTPRGLGFMVVGHAMHHCNVVRERYL